MKTKIYYYNKQKFLINKTYIMFSFEIINKHSFNIDKDIIINIFKLIDKTVLKKQNWILNIVFVTNEEIKELNKNYRQKDYETDVLSFHYYDDFSEINKSQIAWELIFSENKISLQSIEYWLWEEQEFYKLLIHSILHILWYDHEEDSDYEEMFSLESEIWYQIFEKQ